MRACHVPRMPHFERLRLKMWMPSRSGVQISAVTLSFTLPGGIRRRLPLTFLAFSTPLTGLLSLRTFREFSGLLRFSLALSLLSFAGLLPGLAFRGLFPFALTLTGLLTFSVLGHLRFGGFFRLALSLAGLLPFAVGRFSFAFFSGLTRRIHSPPRLRRFFGRTRLAGGIRPCWVAWLTLLGLV